MMGDDPTTFLPPPAPTIEKTVETHEKTVISGDTAGTAQPAPAVIADDNARKGLALAVILQFLGVIGYIVHMGGDTNNAEMMILGAEIGFVTTVLSYYFGSSSGSTAKSALLEKK